MALARALAVQPAVLLLDEPFGALDARVRKELREWLRRLHDEVHVTTVLVTHDQEEAMEVADRVVVMDHGRVQQVGTPRELYEHPANAFVMSFVGPVNQLDGRSCGRTTWSSTPRRCRAPAPRGDGRAADPPRVRGPRRAGADRRRRRLWSQITRDDLERLGWRPSQKVYVEPRRARVRRCRCRRATSGVHG